MSQRTSESDSRPASSPDPGRGVNGGTCQQPTVEELLQRSRDELTADLGILLQHCRAYLLQIANAEVPLDLSVRIAPSDLVQETFVDAYRCFEQFRGTTEAELRGWLRRMLLRNIADARRFFDAQKRQTTGLVSIHGSNASEHGADGRTSPSSLVMRGERSEEIREAMDRLPDEFRLVMKLRYFEGMSLEGIAEQLGKSRSSIKRMWFRGIEKLADLLHDDSSGGR
jgi:RNA polymerase sigma-70 factor (ECF subfamily)